MSTTCRELLCLSHSVTHASGRHRVPTRLALPNLLRSYQLMRQTKSLSPTSISLFQRVFAGCYEPLLGDGPSRRYLCDLCIGAWIHTPSRLSSAFDRFFLLSIGLPLGSRRSTHDKYPQTALSGQKLSRLQSFTNVQAPILAWPSNCSDQGTLCSSQP